MLSNGSNLRRKREWYAQKFINCSCRVAYERSAIQLNRGSSSNASDGGMQTKPQGGQDDRQRRIHDGSGSQAGMGYLSFNKADGKNGEDSRCRLES